jgi:hypothetical protein
MKPGFPRFSAISLLLTLILALVPVPVYAQTATVGPVSPSTIVNDADATITVSGSGFDNTAVALLDSQPLATTPVDAQTLRAVVPAGVTVGMHAITVTMTNGTVTGFANLHVTAPAPTTTPVPAPAIRPQIGVQSYKTKPAEVQYGTDFKLTVKLKNKGQAEAYNVQVSFTSSSFVPLKNGGVNIVGDLPADAAVELDQFMTASSYVYGMVSVDMNLAYSDANGVAYTEKFTLNLQATGGGSGTYATSTPTGVKSSQLVITSYAASIDPLQPGEQFNLAMTVQNSGNARAQRVTMIVGGGSGGTTSLTPQPGGVSGGSGEFTNFAPVGASNVQTLGDLGAGDAIQVKQDLIVNVSTTPGAYPMKVTFSYLNDQGEVINDDQVITLLVYSLPTVDISFYRSPDPFFVGQPGALPIQVVNLGKRLSVLGTIKVTSPSGTVENGTSLVGSLDAGGYFTLDSMITPEQSGKTKLDITIDYTDDFNQPRTINHTLEIDVMEGMIEPTPDPSMGGGGGGEGLPIQAPETTMQKVWRFVLGLFGLDSASPSNGNPEITPGIEEPAVPVKPGTGKG